MKLIMAVLVMAGLCYGTGANITWQGDDGTAPTKYSVVDNWDLGRLPTSEDTIRFNSSALAACSVDVSFNVYDLIMDNTFAQRLKIENTATACTLSGTRLYFDCDGTARQMWISGQIVLINTGNVTVHFSAAPSYVATYSRWYLRGRDSLAIYEPSLTFHNIVMYGGKRLYIKGCGGVKTLTLYPQLTTVTCAAIAENDTIIQDSCHIQPTLGASRKWLSLPTNYYWTAINKSNLYFINSGTNKSDTLPSFTFYGNNAYVLRSDVPQVNQNHLSGNQYLPNATIVETNTNDTAAAGLHSFYSNGYKVFAPNAEYRPCLWLGTSAATMTGNWQGDTLTIDSLNNQIWNTGIQKWNFNNTVVVANGSIKWGDTARDTIDFGTSVWRVGNNYIAGAAPVFIPGTSSLILTKSTGLQFVKLSTPDKQHLNTIIQTGGASLACSTAVYVDGDITLNSGAYFYRLIHADGKNLTIKSGATSKCSTYTAGDLAGTALAYSRIDATTPGTRATLTIPAADSVIMYDTLMDISFTNAVRCDSCVNGGNNLNVTFSNSAILIPTITSIKQYYRKKTTPDTLIGTGFHTSGGSLVVGAKSATITRQVDDTIIFTVPDTTRGKYNVIYTNSGGYKDTTQMRIMLFGGAR